MEVLQLSCAMDLIRNWEMDAFNPWTSQAAVPLFALGGFTLLLCFCFCFILCCLRQQRRESLGYREIFYRPSKGQCESCSVCLDDFVVQERIAFCNCKHSFHLKCLELWLTQNNSCPLCKMAIRPRENTPLVHGANHNQFLNSRVWAMVLKIRVDLLGMLKHIAVKTTEGVWCLLFLILCALLTVGLFIFIVNGIPAGAIA